MLLAPCSLLLVTILVQLFKHFIIFDAVDEFIQGHFIYSFIGQDIHLRPISAGIRDIYIDYPACRSQIEFEHKDIIESIIIIVLVSAFGWTRVIDSECLIRPIKKIYIFGIDRADDFYIIGILQCFLVSSEQFDFADIKGECCRRVPSELIEFPFIPCQERSIDSETSESGPERESRHVWSQIIFLSSLIDGLRS